MKKVTDPDLLAQLEADSAPVASPMGKKVTNPLILAQLDGASEPKKNPLLSEPFQGLGQAITKGPSDLLQQVPKIASYVAGKAGDISEEQMIREGGSPMLARGVNKFISAGPDIAMFATPGTKTKAVVNAAVPMARRALGLSKRFLNTPYARREASQAGRVALEEGVIPWSGNPEVAIQKATTLASESGKKIGDTLGKIKFFEIAPEAELNLEILRKEITKGAEKGIFASVNGEIDRIKTSITELYGRDLTANDFNRLKNTIGNSLNYLADQASQSNNKKVVRSLSDTIRATVRKLVPGDFQSFLKNQRLVNASKTMQKGLNNEISAQQGNMMMSLPSTVVAGGEIARGNLPGAFAVAVEMAKRRGASSAARLLNEIPKQNFSATTSNLLLKAIENRKKR
jgi:hypothetical protein